MSYSLSVTFKEDGKMTKRKMKIGLIAAFAGVFVAAATLGVGAVQKASANTTNGITMKEGAEARLNDSNEKNGIRFTTLLDSNWYDGLSYSTVEVGTLVVPTDLMDATDFIKDTDAERVVYTNPLTKEGDSYVYTGALVTIKDGNLMREFTGVGYVLLDEGTATEKVYYAPNPDTSRSIMYVLSGYLAEGKTDSTGETYAKGKISTAMTRIDTTVTDASLSVTLGDTTYADGDVLSLSAAGTLALSASYGGYDVIPSVELETSSSTLKATQTQDLKGLKVEGIGEGTLTFTVGSKTATLTLTCDDYSQYAIMHEGNKAAFGFVEKWGNGALASVNDLTVETSIVDTMTNGAKGVYTKNVVTFNATGNAKFKISPTSTPKGNYDVYQALANDNPNLGVKLFIYMDGSLVKHTNGNITNLNNTPKSEMFGDASFTPTVSGGIYSITKVMSLADWVAANYAQNKEDSSKMDFSWKNIFTVGGDNTIGTDSQLTCYIAIDFVELDTALYAESASFTISGWGDSPSVSNYTFTAENVTVANSKSGNYVKYNFTQLTGNNSLIKLKNTPVHTYAEYKAMSDANANLKVKLYVYVDGTGINGNKYLNNTVTVPAFDVTTKLDTIGNNKTYEYETSMPLADWLALNYNESGVWKNNSFYQAACSSGYVEGDSYSFYVSVTIGE